ncbi:MAG: hypothetical protein LBQ66_05380 [Planctomycetaceae bacterium]|nr:hypothetical protein [Planctomycetaceae bacterium]
MSGKCWVVGHLPDFRGTPVGSEWHRLRWRTALAGCWRVIGLLTRLMTNWGCYAV